MDGRAEQPRRLGASGSVLMLTDGSLLVSDDGGKKIWRVSYGGTKS